MKKILATTFFLFFFNFSAIAQTYYFKECRISNAATGNYIINFDQNVIEVNLKALDGREQNFKDKIKIIEKDKVVSEKIKSSKGENIYYQYFLDSKSNSVIKIEYIKEAGLDMNIFKLKQKTQSACKTVKADWNKNQLEQAKINKEEKEIRKAQEKMQKEQKSKINCQGNDFKKWTNCKGTYKSENGHKYIGIFIKGEIVKGTATYAGGSKYVGDFQKYEPHGFGTFLWKNGDKYFGEWKNGMSNGNGSKVWSDGREYAGTFKNDKLHGKGTLYYPDGKKYVGEFIDGKRHGEGTFTYADGFVYVGKFVSGKEKGVGECFDADGSIVPCANRTSKKTEKKNYSGKNTKSISIVSKKWVRISQYENNTKRGKKIMDKLKNDFELRAAELCSSTGNYKTLIKNIEVLDIDETPAYGLETKLKIAIQGAVECI